MLDNPGQHRGELCAFGRVEGSERLVLRRGEHPVEIEQSPAPALGEGDDVASPIGRVGCSFDETPGDECGDGGGDVAAIESAATGEGELTGRRVWLGRGAGITGRVGTGESAVGGWRSLVRGQKVRANRAVAGTPARVIREGITWRGDDLGPLAG